MNRKLKTVIVVFAGLLILSGVGISRNSFVNPVPDVSSVFSDFLVLIAINLLVLISLRTTASPIFSVTKRLKKMGWTAIFLTVFILLISNIVQPPSGDRILRAFPEYDFSNNVLIISLIVLLSCLLSVSIIKQLYGFIMLKRKHRTRTLFMLMYTSLLVYLVLSVFLDRDLIAEGWRLQEDPVHFIALVSGCFAVFFMVMNSYRNAWVNNLNKKQKIFTLFAGIAILISLIIAERISEGVFILYLGGYSMSAAIFINMTKYFLMIYFVLAILSLLLHLPTAGIFDKKVLQLASLFRISSAATTILQFDNLLKLTTKQMLEVVEADSAWLMMKNGRDRLFNLSATSNVSASLLRVIKDNSFLIIIDRITETKNPLIIDVLYEIKELPLEKNVRKTGCSLIGAPLVSSSRGVIGILFAYKSINYGFDQEDAEMIKAFANQTTVAIENSLLLEESLDKERLQQELNVARDIQLKLLPKEIPDIAVNIHVDAVSIPANEVGGDYYDFIQLTEDKWGIYIADVSGKSVSAALYMAEIKGFIQALARLYHTPKELLIQVNQTLFTNIDRKSFISLLAAVIDLKENKVVFTRAGHTPLGYFNASSGSWELLQPQGLGLGLDKGEIFNRIIEEVSVDFKPGCSLFFYTDGVTEVFNSKGEEFGEERLLEVLDSCKKENAANYCEKVLTEIDKFSRKIYNDDITMVTVRFDDISDKEI